MLTVGVLRGGIGGEHEVSLRSGSTILENLSKDKYKTLDIFIDKEGTWHRRGIPIKPADALRTIDVVMNGLHGEYGEGGSVQRVLERSHVPYAGSGIEASWMCMNKEVTQEFLKEKGIRVPQNRVLGVSDHLTQKINEVFRSLSPPWVIKPVTGGSSVGVSIAKSHHELLQGIGNAFEYSPKVLIEEYIRGREATCGVIDNLRGEKTYALFPVEIIHPKDNPFFDYDAKYSGKTQEICPGNFSQKDKVEIQRIAKEVHSMMGLRDYSRSDFIVSPSGIYFLEVNTLPGMSKESLLPKSLDALGVSIPSFLDHLIDLALSRK